MALCTKRKIIGKKEFTFFWTRKMVAMSSFLKHEGFTYCGNYMNKTKYLDLWPRKKAIEANSRPYKTTKGFTTFHKITKYLTKQQFASRKYLRRHFARLSCLVPLGIISVRFGTAFVYLFNFSEWIYCKCIKV